MSFDHNELAVLATALTGFITDQRYVLEMLENRPSAKSTCGHAIGEIKIAERLLERINNVRFDQA